MWKLLAEKGKIATLIGLLLALPSNIWFLWKFFHLSELSVSTLESLAIINGLAMFWFMMPSTIKIVSKALTIEIID